jgi:hypothetical protein
LREDDGFATDREITDRIRQVTQQAGAGLL